MAEVYEWWAVSDFFARDLEAKGEVIYRGGDCPIWGRCATGQAIALDGVIQTLALELSWIREAVTHEA